MTKYTTEKMRSYMREKRKQRKSEGVCVTCGSYPAKKGRVDCDKCVERTRRNYFKRRSVDKLAKKGA